MRLAKLLSLCGACAVTAAGLVLFAPPAHGQATVIVEKSVERIPTRRVSFADLDIASLAGAKMLNHRVGRAVNQVCYEAVGLTANFYEHVWCRSSAWRRARPQIARAVQHARDVAAIGTSDLTAVAITISSPK